MKKYYEVVSDKPVDILAEEANGYAVFACGSDKYNAFNEGFKEAYKLFRPITGILMTKEEGEKVKYEGVLLGLKICKEMFAQGQISHENIYENEVYYKELIQNLTN